MSILAGVMPGFLPSRHSTTIGRSAETTFSGVAPLVGWVENGIAPDQEPDTYYVATCLQTEIGYTSRSNSIWLINIDRNRYSVPRAYVGPHERCLQQV